MSSKITKISAKSRKDQSHDDQSHESQKHEDRNRKIKAEKPTKISKTDKKTKSQSGEKPLKSVFILVRPFVALGRYLRDSWRELRMVRWPNRKATWKMTLAVLVYCAIFMVFILLLDMLFTFIFNLIFGIN